MDTRRLRYFLIVAREGSFSRAAEILQMTQPPLSLAVSQLETDLGVQLLVRSSRGAVPTEAGRYLIEFGSRVLGQLNDLTTDLRQMGSGTKGRIAIASVPVTTWVVVPSALQRFLRAAPDVDVSVIDLPPVQVLERVMRETVDLGVITVSDSRQFEDTYGEHLHFRHCGDLEMAVGLPPYMRDETPDRVSLASLHDQTWLIPRRSMRIQSIEDTFNEIWRLLRMPVPHVRWVTTMQTAIPLVVAGLGVTILPKALTPMSHPDLVVRDVVEELPPTHVVAVWPKSGSQSPAMAALLAELAVDVPAGRGKVEAQT